MITFWRIIQSGGRNFMRNAWLSTAATAVMTVTLSIVAISFISNLALTSTIKGVTDKIDVSIFLKLGVTTEQVDGFTKSLKASPNVESVKYVTEAEAVTQYLKQKGDNKSAQQAFDITGNILPSSLQVKAKDPKKLDDIIAVVNQPENKDLLDPGAPPSYTGSRKTTIDRIVSFSNFFKSTGLVASAIFVIISTLIIFNTIRMAIFTRRDEIEIMKLVGATKWFIRGPFIVEAALYGVIGAFIAVALSYVLLLGGGPKLASYVDVNSTIDFFRNYPLLVIGAEMLIGVLIGMFSSLLAMSRYLKL
jgi:cell division transport system permease protein